jgi:hypothetical protein
MSLNSVTHPCSILNHNPFSLGVSPVEMRQKRGVMKQKLIPIALSAVACIFLFSAVAAARGGQLVAAEFGAGNHRADVTQQVR